jgi:uncharacterized membrane protein
MIFAILAGIFIAFGRILDKWVLTNRLRKSSQYFFVWSMWLFVFSALIPFLFTKVFVPSFDLLVFIFLSGLFHVIGFLTFYKALSMGDVSSVAPLTNLRIVFLIPLTFFFAGEFYGISSVFLIIVTFLGGLLVTWNEKVKVRNLLSVKNAVFWLLMFTVFIWIISDLFAKSVLVRGVDSWNFNLWRDASAIFWLLLLFPIFFKNELHSISLSLRKSSVYSLAASGLFYVGIIFYFMGVSSTLQLTTVSSVAAQALVTFFAGFIISSVAPKLLKEKHTKKIYAIRFLGVVLMLVSVYFLAGIHL